MKNLFTLIFSLILLSSSGQVVVPVGQGLPAHPLYSTSDQNYAYFGSYVWQTQETIIHRWNGLSWSSLPAITDPVLKIQAHQGQVYAAVQGANWYETKLLTFNNGSWQQVGPLLNGVIQDMDVYNGNLVLAGDFSPSSSIFGVISWDGSSFSQLGDLSFGDSISDINVINNKLWAAGQINQMWNNDTAMVVRLDDQQNVFDYPATKREANVIASGWPRAVFSINNKVYVKYWSGVYEIRNDSLIEIATSNSFMTNYAEAGNQVYFTSSNNLQVFDGNAMMSLSNVPSGTYSLEYFQSNLYVSFHQPTWNNWTYNYIFMLPIQLASIVQGNFYFDANANCLQDGNETMPVTGSFDLSLGSYSITVASTNNYYLLLPPGSYTVSNIQSLDPKHKYLQASSNCNTALNFTIGLGQNHQLDIPFEHNQVNDLSVQLRNFRGWRVRQGFTEGMELYLSNPGANQPGPVTVEYIVPSGVQFINSFPPPTSSAGNVHTYTFPSMSSFTDHSVIIHFKPTAGVGNNVCFNARIVNPASDSYMADNTDTICPKVVAAYDPNDKTANVDRALPGLDRIDYHVRFQNTGTDTAYKVVVVDTLESYFDPATIKLLGASHNYTFKIVDDSILVWTFDNILLPDSTTNLIGSQGYFMFSIGVDATLPLGSIIDNDAEIYFDYQAPVHTNHAQTLITQFIGLVENLEPSMKLYPNPVQNELQLEWEGSVQNIRLFNSSGQSLRSWTPSTGQENMTIDLSEFTNGLYILEIGSSRFRVLKLD
ncbi:DUF7619 domain-containing protein [Croceimicrobium hydrocarbonivorans]|uniref:T9SS type A sorting domain-containing protein n=1 Tax=Croceimicrobium hydrocarbonivorans TaxID=2761580 RepID=A0A7H0VJA7_9FLAO|nr:T9SS type A sorting domain-containing protein [Croceimicrobium hydrocarbonivorans]QNR25805.1 T9SS type A sorting domain-containing protein [Croceimicrobium hydrocarbonivorans]